VRARTPLCAGEIREREREEGRKREEVRANKTPACARVRACVFSAHARLPWMRERERNKRGSTKSWLPRRHPCLESANIFRRDRNRSSSAVLSITSTIKSNQIIHNIDFINYEFFLASSPIEKVVIFFPRANQIGNDVHMQINQKRHP